MTNVCLLSIEMVSLILNEYSASELSAIGLLYLVYCGKNWARIILIILFSLAILVSIVALIGLDVDYLLKIPFVVMILVYGIAIYHFSFAKITVGRTA